MNTFKKATKTQSYLRMALVGPSGSGKTYSSLRIAQGLGARIAVIDSERGSASKYADEFAFDVMELESFSPDEYREGITAAIRAGYDVLIIDSLTHAWDGKGGILEMHDAAQAQDRSGNSWTAWRLVTPAHNRLVDAILQSPLHIIVTMRSKMDYVAEKDDRGKTVIRKVGLKPIQRDGLEFEFDVVGDMDVSNTLTVTKTRCRSLARAMIQEPGAENVGEVLKTWLTDGAPLPIGETHIKELWQLAKARGMGVPDLLVFINDTLHTTYQSPREMTLEQFAVIRDALQAPVDTPTDQTATG